MAEPVASNVEFEDEIAILKELSGLSDPDNLSLLKGCNHNAQKAAIVVIDRKSLSYYVARGKQLEPESSVAAVDRVRETTAEATAEQAASSSPEVLAVGANDRGTFEVLKCSFEDLPSAGTAAQGVSEPSEYLVRRRLKPSKLRPQGVAMLGSIS